MNTPGESHPDDPVSVGHVHPIAEAPAQALAARLANADLNARPSLNDNPPLSFLLRTAVRAQAAVDPVPEALPEAG